MHPGPTLYTKVADSQVAYQVTGSGPVDFVYMLGIGNNFERWWDWPPFAEMLGRFATFGRLILFDRRGSGISDPLLTDGLSTWESFADDLGAVLDAAGSTEAVVMACFDGGAVALTYAAMNPDRVRGLILWNSYARATEDDDYSIGRPAGSQQEMNEMMQAVWGTEDLSRYLAGDDVSDEYLAWHTKLMRGACTPASYAKQNALMTGADARAALALVRVPVLVLHAMDYPILPPELGRYVAEHVADGRFVGLPGATLDIFQRADRYEIFDTIEEFATGMPPAARSDRVLASVLFTDIVGSTERAAGLGDARWKAVLEAHDRTARAVVGTWRGELIKSTGDGLLATFDGPGRAIQAALELGRRLSLDEIEIRAGVHFGEIEVRSDGDIGGIGVHVAARAMGFARSGEVVCTRTVKELSLGSAIDFEDRGAHQLKGVPDEWNLFAVRT